MMAGDVLGWAEGRGWGKRTCVDLDAAPVERVGHVVPDVFLVGEEEDVVEAYTASCL